MTFDVPDELNPAARAIVKIGRDALKTIDRLRKEKSETDFGDFADGVEPTIRGIIESIERTGTLTANQKRAIENMADGVEKWDRPSPVWHDDADFER